MIHAFGKSSMIALRSRHARHVEISGRDSWVSQDREVMEHSGDVTRLGSRVGAAPDARPIGSGDERSRRRGMVGEPHRTAPVERPLSRGISGGAAATLLSRQ